MPTYTREQLIEKFYKAQTPYNEEYWANSDNEKEAIETFIKDMNQSNEPEEKEDDMSLGTLLNNLSIRSIKRIKAEERKRRREEKQRIKEEQKRKTEIERMFILCKYKEDNMFLCRCGSYILEKIRKKTLEYKKT